MKRILHMAALLFLAAVIVYAAVISPRKGMDTCNSEWEAVYGAGLVNKADHYAHTGFPDKK